MIGMAGGSGPEDSARGQRGHRSGVDGRWWMLWLVGPVVCSPYQRLRVGLAASFAYQTLKMFSS
jgi:hypothetical protein